jgi:hypothetical protein
MVYIQTQVLSIDGTQLYKVNNCSDKGEYCYLSVYKVNNNYIVQYGKGTNDDKKSYNTVPFTTFYNVALNGVYYGTSDKLNYDDIDFDDFKFYYKEVIKFVNTHPHVINEIKLWGSIRFLFAMVLFAICFAIATDPLVTNTNVIGPARIICFSIITGLFSTGLVLITWGLNLSLNL